MEHFKLKLDRTSIEHRRPSINVRSLLLSTNCVTKETISQSANCESFRAKMRNTPTCFPILTILYLVVCSRKMKKSTPLWCEDCRYVCFDTGLSKPMLTLNDSNCFKIPQLCILSISNCEWHCPVTSASECAKYVNPCLNFLGIPDERTVYPRLQARSRWTSIRRSSITPTWLRNCCSISAQNNIFLGEGLGRESSWTRRLTYHERVCIWIAVEFLIQDIPSPNA